MQPLISVFLDPASNAAQGKRKQATLAFLGLWLFTNVCAVQCNYLLLNVEALLLLNTAASLGGVVVATSLSNGQRSRTDGRGTYPFLFGYARMSILFRAAAACLVVFGCITLLLEASHRAMHVHHTKPVLIALCCGLHGLLLLYFRQEVVLCDRVVGPGGARDAMCAEEELVDSVCRLKSEKDEHAAGAAKQRERRVGRTLLVTARLLLLPLCIGATLALRVLESFEHSRVDILVALFLALYYGYVSCRQADWMIWLLLNNNQQNPHVRQTVDAAIKDAVLSSDGVLAVLSCAIWHVGAQDKTCLLRLQVAAGADPARITALAKEALLPLCRHVLVECFGLGETPQLFVAQQATEHHHHDHAHTHGEGCCGGGGAHHDHTHAHAHAHSSDIPVHPMAVPMEVDPTSALRLPPAPTAVLSAEKRPPGRPPIVVLGISTGPAAAPAAQPATYVPQYKPFNV